MRGFNFGKEGEKAKFKGSEKAHMRTRGRPSIPALLSSKKPHISFSQARRNKG